MLIKKNFQGEIPANKIMGTHTESDADTYSCNYINKTRSAVTAFITGESSYTTEERGSFNDYVKSGTALSVEDNSIVIGKGVSKVIISSNFNVQTGSGSAMFFLTIYIRKNGSIIMKNIDYKPNVPEWNYASMSIPPFVAEVKEGDKITIGVSGTRDVRIHNDEYGKTYLSIEVLE